MSQSALVTGCSRGGLGDAMAQAFRKANVKVFATARDLNKIQHLKDIGCEVLLLDVTSESSIREAVSTITKLNNGRLDFLVNNAGRGKLLLTALMKGHTSPLSDISISDARQTFEVNVLSVLAVSQAFLPLLIEAKGRVINIGSIGGKASLSRYQGKWSNQYCLGVYAASKAALNMMSETMRVELAPFGVHVITVIAGTINDTPFYTNQPSLQIREGSIYSAIRDTIATTQRGERLKVGAMSASDFAKGVVSNSMKPKPRLWFWHGGRTMAVWIITVFLPHTFLVRRRTRQIIKY
ncbi:hypothetical protein BGW36DRAFT_299432 [Talaromyces proteolyticus]|uniref:Uncharacterized protein n=1 Tax=Talaromyces proteolyticus TaxID=1131652 RepID=A0AAD4KN14_9EURO|nr:uncharacterized protein BGW36DRAFT_299432 [Talaromyces proteolyticus]KAH8695332.1 hypothetical protein BGW36DRAFT_299432 [Talaromyces proteolyticus]